MMSLWNWSIVIDSNELLANKISNEFYFNSNNLNIEIRRKNDRVIIDIHSLNQSFKDTLKSITTELIPYLDKFIISYDLVDITLRSWIEKEAYPVNFELATEDFQVLFLKKIHITFSIY